MTKSTIDRCFPPCLRVMPPGHSNDGEKNPANQEHDDCPTDSDRLIFAGILRRLLDAAVGDCVGQTSAESAIAAEAATARF